MIEHHIRRPGIQFVRSQIRNRAGEMDGATRPSFLRLSVKNTETHVIKEAEIVSERKGQEVRPAQLTRS